MSTSTVSKRIRVGIIGASPSWGWATHAHLPALKTLPSYEITAVSTTKQESAAETARRFDVPHAFGSSAPLIEHPEVDLVVVSVRAPEHAPLVRAAIAAKKHVLCEWPLGVSTAETIELASLAEKAGVRTAIGLQRRLAPGVRYLRDLIHEGYIGKVRSVSLRISVPFLGATRPRAYAYTADVNNGVNALHTVGAHFLDTALAAVGDIASISAVIARQFDTTTIIESGEAIPVTAPDQVVLSGTLANGAVLAAHFEAGKRNGSEITCTITGTEGDLLLSADLTVSGAQGDGNPLTPLPTPEGYFWSTKGTLSDDAHQMGELYAAFARDLAEGTKLAPTFADAESFHRLLATIEEASATGQRRNWKG
ncbi:putative oxidoreductase [Minicystis rosea]|nr:putative oxidoreductase [Minicystis rosea]